MDHPPTKTTKWTSDELSDIEAAQELEMAAVRRDGTLRKPVPIWVVRAGDDLYVRAAYGPGNLPHRACRDRPDMAVKARSPR
jgi:hypothetical protein